MTRYCIKSSYSSRSHPEAYDPVEQAECQIDGVVWQPDVYELADELLKRLNGTTVVDVGSGRGEKLACFSAGTRLVAIDYRDNVDHLADLGRFIDGRCHDLDDATTALPLNGIELGQSIIVCSDVIEHLVRPEVLCAKLHSCIVAGLPAIVLSTPDRDRTWGTEHDGPPPNPLHVREWNRDELCRFLEREGFETGLVGFTRSVSAQRTKNTVLALLFAEDRHMRSALPPRWRLIATLSSRKYGALCRTPKPHASDATAAFERGWNRMRARLALRTRAKALFSARIRK